MSKLKAGELKCKTKKTQIEGVKKRRKLKGHTAVQKVVNKAFDKVCICEGARGKRDFKLKLHLLFSCWYSTWTLQLKASLLA